MTKLNYLLLSLEANPDPAVMCLNIEEYLKERDAVSYAEKVTISNEPIQIYASQAVQIAELKAQIFDVTETEDNAQ